MIIYDFAEEFCKAPGPRTEDIGPCSGERFRIEVLEPWFQKNTPVEIDASGTVMTFGPSFLSEAFGKIAFKYKKEKFFEIIHIKKEGIKNQKLEESMIKYVQIALSKSK